MTSRARPATALTLALVLIGALPQGASADGLPAGIGIAATPLSAPEGEVQYTARILRRASLVEARERASGRRVRSARLRGDYAVPAGPTTGRRAACRPTGGRWS